MPKWPLTLVLLMFALPLSAQVSQLRRAGQPVVRYMNPAGLVHNPRYTQVVEVQGGRTILIAGQAAFDQKGTAIGKGDFAAQASKVFENLDTALAEVGATFNNVVKLNAYIVNIPANINVYRDVLARHLPKNSPPPASTTVGVAALVSPDLLLEVDAIAVAPEEKR